MKKSNLICLFIILLSSLMGGCRSGRMITADNKTANLTINSLDPANTPVFLDRPVNKYFSVTIGNNDPSQIKRIHRIEFEISDDSDYAAVSEISVVFYTSSPYQSSVFGKTTLSGKRVVIPGDYALENGANFISVYITPSDKAKLTDTFGIESCNIFLEDGSFLPVSVKTLSLLRFARVIRAAGQDGVDTYRIPGLATTNAGTLIAVYDNRYNNSKDLQENIDIGMSRSTDGGQTWEPMKVIMDMGEYLGLSQQLNGIGDPCILYDNFTNTIWVAALWMSGSAPDKMLWWDSRPGIKPQETGQFILVKSTDDGVTWSHPINITEQIKDPSWQLLMQGPGRGITLSDGTLVFPAQFKKDNGVRALDGGQYTSHSTIVYSKDGGNTWHTGSGAKSNTTEAQVVQLSDGSLMLNMRDDRNRKDKDETNGRAVAVTRDLGQTWIVHPSSNSALPEPNCMASLIAADLTIRGLKKKILFFTNPNDKYRRIKMTIKTSFDEGLTWPENNWTELYGPECYGYSCMTILDDNTVGILYEGSKELYFQILSINELTGGN